MDTPPSVRFESAVEITDSTPVLHILRFPKKLVAAFGFKGNLRRVTCTLNGTERFNCALFPRSDSYFLTLSKQLRKKLGVEVGDAVSVELEKEESKYGLPMPDEFAEVLRQDDEGKQLFDALSPGRQRLMIALILFDKDVDKRITRSLVGLELLKRSNGKFDYHAQHDTMRLATGRDLGFKLEN